MRWVGSSAEAQAFLQWSWRSAIPGAVGHSALDRGGGSRAWAWTGFHPGQAPEERRHQPHSEHCFKRMKSQIKGSGRRRHEHVQPRSTGAGREGELLNATAAGGGPQHHAHNALHNITSHSIIQSQASQGLWARKLWHARLFLGTLAKVVCQHWSQTCDISKISSPMPQVPNIVARVSNNTGVRRASVPRLV